MTPSCEMDLQGNICHGAMISHLGICATAANIANWFIAVASDGREDLELFLYFHTTEPPSLNLICLFIMLGYRSVSGSIAH